MSNLCSICLENIEDTEDSYSLPECDHNFHTDCIVTWFRVGNDKCPLCSNTGINNNYNFSETKSLYRTASEHARSKESSKEIKKVYEQIRKKKEQLKTIRQQMKELRSNEIYREINKKVVQLRRRKWRVDFSLRRTKQLLCSMIPIKKIIIATKVKI